MAQVKLGALAKRRARWNDFEAGVNPPGEGDDFKQHTCASSFRALAESREPIASPTGDHSEALLSAIKTQGGDQ